MEKAGRIGSRVRVSLTETPLDLPALSRKDREDLMLAAKEKVDFVMLSNTRCAEAVYKAREILIGFM